MSCLLLKSTIFSSFLPIFDTQAGLHPYTRKNRRWSNIDHYIYHFNIQSFYVVYYTLLSGFFIAMLLIFYQTLDEKSPKWQNANGIIGTNPGKTISMLFMKKLLHIGKLIDIGLYQRWIFRHLKFDMQRIHSFSRVIDN